MSGRGDTISREMALANCSEIPNNSDCISRQTAITAIQKAYADTEGGTDKCAVWKNVGLTNALHIMQDLPSAQPEKHTEERTETHACDSISRQAAIDALIRKIRPHNNGDGTITMCVMSEELVRETLNDLPAAQPERKTGRWIEEHIDITDKERPKSFRFHRCSACGYVAAPALFVDEEKWLSYCPHCGAYMKG